MKRRMKHKIIYSLLLVSLLAAGCNQKKTSPAPVPESTQPVESQQAQKPLGQTPTVQNAGQPDYAPSPVQPAPSQEQSQDLTVYQAVQGSNTNLPSYQIKENTTALDLLKTSHQVETKDYGSLGEMVVSVDSMKARVDQFWAFYVNGKLANVGAGSYILRNHDKVEWKLNSVNSYQPNS